MITRHRININFLVYKRVRARWIVDAFKQDGRTVAVRCYKTSVHGGHSQLQDGWLARGDDNVAQRRAEIAKIIKSKHVRATREEPSLEDGGHPIRSLNDIRL